jgi:hypothetical protein
MEEQFLQFNLPNRRIEMFFFADQIVTLNSSKYEAMKKSSLVAQQTNEEKAKYTVFMTPSVEQKPLNRHSLEFLVSHLRAIYEAVEATEDATDDSCSSKYAIIMEDDNKIVYDVDFQQLIDSAPSDFATLQLKSSGPYKSLLSSYSILHCEGTEGLWTKYTKQMHPTDMYLINLEKWRPMIKELVHASPLKAAVKDYSYNFFLFKVYQEESLFAAYPPSLNHNYFINYAFDHTYTLNMPLTLYAPAAVTSTVNNNFFCFTVKKFIQSPKNLPTFFSFKTLKQTDPTISKFFLNNCHSKRHVFHKELSLLNCSKA